MTSTEPKVSGDVAEHAPVVQGGGYELIGSPGCGSAIVEAALVLSGLPFVATDIPFNEPGAGRDRLLALNPLGQVPTLILPDGTVLTESLACLFHIDDMAPEAGLILPPSDARRAVFLNRLVWLVAAIYPSFTYGDFPERWSDGQRLRTTTDAHREELWRTLDAALAPSPFACGARPSALDLYIAVMSWWRPRRAWFEAHTPRLASIARATEAHETLRYALARHAAAAGAYT